MLLRLLTNGLWGLLLGLGPSNTARPGTPLIPSHPRNALDPTPQTNGRNRWRRDVTGAQTVRGAGGAAPGFEAVVRSGQRARDRSAVRADRRARSPPPTRMCVREWGGGGASTRPEREEQRPGRRRRPQPRGASLFPAAQAVRRDPAIHARPGRGGWEGLTFILGHGGGGRGSARTGRSGLGAGGRRRATSSQVG